MRPSRRRRRRRNRISRLLFELFEPRLFLSGDWNNVSLVPRPTPQADFHLDYFVENQLQEETHTSKDQGPGTRDQPAIVTPDPWPLTPDPWPLTPDPWPLTTDSLTGLDQVRSEYAFTGSGQTVALIDSGIAYKHYALGGGFGLGARVVGGFDFTAERDADPYDDGPFGSHGTHVAGILASSALRISPGVAPEVDLVGLRVFDDAGDGQFRWIEEALRWVHARRNDFPHPITTVNLSLGAQWNSNALPGWAMLEDELSQLAADGIFVSAAAGNDFSPQNGPGLSYPAVSPHVVPVASVDGNGALSYFSQRNGRVIAAPGRSVLSTVPDYVGNRNGVDDDFARYSGTSMAAPYVAGASVLLRQAYEFVGVANVSPEMLYKVMVRTADSVYDPATAKSYHRLNLHRAIDAIMPADDYGSAPATAYDLGTIVDTTSLSGTIGKLTDSDWFRFTAAVTGSVTVQLDTTAEMLPQWQLPAGVIATAAGDLLSMPVLAGETYAFGLTSGDGLGHYQFDLDLAPNYTDWGIVRQQRFEANPIDAPGQWFALTAAADGILTVEALFARAGGSVDLELFDASHRLVAARRGNGDHQRLDVAARAGDSFYLHAYARGGTNQRVDFRVTNLVSRHGDEVHVSGTAGDDHFTYSAGAVHRLTINGVSYRFASPGVSSITFDGGAGQDRAVLVGTDGDDSAVLRPGSVEVSGPGYRLQASQVETVTLRGGGGFDRAEFHDSAGADTFYASVGFAEMSGRGFVHRAQGFAQVRALATAGGEDVARLVDSPGDDVFFASPVVGVLHGRGFDHRVHFFEQVQALATAGGNDLAKLIDSAGDDVFFASPVLGMLYGRGFSNQAKFFEQVYADAREGGTDVARLRDSAGDDTFSANSVGGRFSGRGFDNQARFFDEIHAYALAGGTDLAKLFDSPGNDTFLASPTGGTLSGDGFLNEARFFDGLHAYATAGGYDLAKLSDSAGNDVLVSSPVSSALFGSGFYNRAKFFEEVFAGGQFGGQDKAFLDDSTLDDYFRASGTGARILSDRALTRLYGFEYVRATAQHGGTNRAEVAAVDYLLELDGEWS